MHHPRLGSKKSELGSSFSQKNRLLNEGKNAKTYCFSLKKTMMNCCIEVSDAMSLNY